MKHNLIKFGTILLIAVEIGVGYSIVPSKHYESEQSHTVLVTSPSSYTSTIQEIGLDEILNQEQYFYYVYIYSETCGYCGSIASEISEFLENRPHYLVNYKKAKAMLTSEFIPHVIIEGVPTLLIIENNELINSIVGASAILQYISSKNN
ncbi:MAG: thioredoxin family protein [Erysipelotrichaceae bacterium]|nr:thioredoxin family protein [Erysipelotrichaceae bacterium]